MSIQRFYKGIRFSLFTSVLAVAMMLRADVATVDGYTWEFTLNNGEACICKSVTEPTPDGTVTHYVAAVTPLPSGDIEIPSTLNGFPVKSIGMAAFLGCSNLTSVTIPTGVKTIEGRVFLQCPSLRRVIFPSTMETKPSYAFDYQSNASLTTITVDSDNPRYASDNGILYNHDKTELLMCPFGKTSVVVKSGTKRIGEEGFIECRKLTSVILPESVEEIGAYAFTHCDKLSAIELPTELETIEACAFRDCFAMSVVEIPARVSYIGMDAFGGCASLQSIIVADENDFYSSYDGALYEYNVENKREMFLMQCPCAKKTLQVPEGVVEILDMAAANCYDLEAVSFPSTLRRIAFYAFSECESLASVRIPASVIELDRSSFWKCHSLLVFEVDSENQRYASVDGIVCNKQITNVICCPAGRTSIVIPSGVTSLTQYPFCGSDAVKVISIPASVTTIETCAMFTDCHNLECILVDAGNPEFCSIDGILYSKSGEMLLHCPRGLSNVVIPEGVRTLDMWSIGGSKLSSLEIPTSVTDIYSTAIWSESLRCITIPTCVTEVNKTFQHCPNIEEIALVEGFEKIVQPLFEGCGSLRKVVVPSSVREVDFAAFENCTELTDVYFQGAAPSVINGQIELKNVVFHSSPSNAGWLNWHGVKLALDGQGKACEDVTMTITNVVLHVILNSYRPDFVALPSGETGFVNILTEVKGGSVAVPESWTENYPDFKTKFGTDFTKALAMQTGKKDGAGNPMFVWQDYVAGTDPTKEDDVFVASITMVDGKVVISYTPELDEARKAMRKYTTWGKKSLMDTNWTEVREGHEDEYNFFKVSVEMR